MQLRRQFGIRTLLLLTVLAAVPCAYVGWHWQQQRRETDAVERLLQAGHSVGHAEGPHRSWLGNVHSVSAIHFRPLATDTDLANVRYVRGARVIALQDAVITDAGLAALAGCDELQLLFLSNTPIGDAGLVHLRGLTQLSELHLDGTQVTDAGILQLTELPLLQAIYVSRTKLTEAGLAKFHAVRPEVAFLGTP